MRRFVTRLSVLSIALALAACSSSPVGFTLSGEPGFYKKLNASTAKVDTVAARDMISIYRANKNLARLTIDPALQKAAEEQVLAMARADRMSHEVGGSLMSRLNGRLDHTRAVENISAGYHTLAEAFSGWRDSPAHNKNMLNPEMRRMGIATAYVPESKYKVYWALILTD
ncbi:MAG: hypothetical protein JWN07_2957 [Hyphomicrobiales bacterium]|nr:hypothetical protein [Hyphomicrobiales bacterium]